MKKLIIILALSTGFVLSYAIAQPGKYDDFQGKGRQGQNRQFSDRGPREGRGLINLPDLTEEQKNKIEDLKVEHIKNTKSHRDAVMAKEVELHALTTEETVNMSKINDLIEDIGKIRIDLQKKRVTHQQEIRELLTEKQRVIFDSHRPMGRGHGQKRGPRF